MDIRQAIKERILILDGAMGTMLQRGLSEEQTLRAYIDAGADIITTNSFNANRISLAGEGLGAEAPRLAFEAATRARKVADEAPRKVWVAGSVGPTGKSLTLPSDADDPAYREYGFDDFVEAYREQIDALARGGADLILLETCFDALNAKAAIKALDDLGAPLPIIISATVSDRSGRTLTGQTLEAFYHAVAHAPGLLAFGINCALGAGAMAPLARDIASFSRHPVSFYPNAGIPDETGSYNDSPALMAGIVRELALEGTVNIVGGCCGTSPDHIRAIAQAVKGLSPHRPLERKGLTVSGLEAFAVDPARNFTNVGERTNVAGSRKFARLVASDAWDEAIGIAAAQIEGGADIIDVNMDDPMVDSGEKMRTFLRRIAAEPSVSRAAVMIDSSHWETVLEGLKNCPGRSIVNSISLKEGEEDFVRKALTVKSLGGAMVVMAFDESGQATTLDRKIEICSRSYRLLTEAGIPASDIIFDANILSIGTGIAEHARFGVDFIDAVRWIKENLPGALTSGGVSNLSFAFRGNNAVREAMHSVFLYHAIKAGLDMAIVNPQMLQIYDEVPEDLRKAVEDVIFDSDPEATSRLVAMASRMLDKSGPAPSEKEVPKGPSDPEERLSDDLVKGLSANVSEDALKCLEKLGSAVAVIEGPLMRGMERVGDLFGDGRMFLPQVVKSARTMREAVSFLQPYMGSDGGSGTRPRFVIATVQGDVHDIGKNITSIVLQCSGFEVIDLGVMVPCGEILSKAVGCGACMIGVSGLITPSLQRMEEICREMSSRGMDIPLFVGGAAASAVHTAVKLAPLYANVHYGADASQTAVKAKKCLADPEGFTAEEAESHSRLAALRSQSPSGRAEKPSPTGEGGFPEGVCFEDIPLTELGWETLEPHFDWRMFYSLCGLRPFTHSAGCSCPECQGLEYPYAQYRAQALALVRGLSVKAAAKFFPCRREGDTLLAGPLRLPMLRDGASCLADFFPASGESPLGIFAATVRKDGGIEDEVVGHAARAALAEAASLYLQSVWKKSLPSGQKLIAPGIGYPCCPDHSLKRDILASLPEGLGITLTDSCAMTPEESVCGLVIAHRDARYLSVRTVDSAALDAYSAARGFSPSERELFLSHLEIRPKTT